MPVLSKTDELLEYVRPFRIGSGRLPADAELKTIEAMAIELEKENPTSELAGGFDRLAGMWECIFTSSRFVLGLDHLPLVRTSAVYQYVVVDSGAETGYYFNIAELSWRGAVKCVCGEYANIRASEVHVLRLDVQYEWFYFGLRALSPYEGHIAVADELETGSRPSCVRLPFRGFGWQSTLYLSDRLRVVRGNKGGLFVMIKCDSEPYSQGAFDAEEFLGCGVKLGDYGNPKRLTVMGERLWSIASLTVIRLSQ